MAIQVRKGNEADFDVNKMLPAEFAVCTDTGKVFVCTSAGNTKELASVEELQGILGASDEAYQAFQELMEQMDNDTVVTGLLADVSNLKTGNYTISFSEPEERGNIEPSDTVKTIFGKIRKVIADLAAVSFSGKYSSLVFTDIESVTAPSDENTMILDSSGTPQKITWANVFSTISDGIKAKILEWTFANLTTTNKTIPGAINELNMKNANYEIRTISGTTDSAGYIAIGELSETYAPVAVVSLTKWRRVSAILTTEKYYAYISEWGSETSMPGVDISLLCIFAKV